MTASPGTAARRAQALGARLPPLLVAAERVAATVAQGVHGRRRVGQGDGQVARPLGAGQHLSRTDQPPGLEAVQPVGSMAVQDQRPVSPRGKAAGPEVHVVVDAVAARQQHRAPGLGGAPGRRHDAPEGRQFRPAPRGGLGRAGQPRPVARRVGAEPGQDKDRQRGGDQQRPFHPLSHPCWNPMSQWAVRRALSAGVQPSGAVTATQGPM